MAAPEPPLVTIGIPTYCRAALLHRSIESALNQSYGRVEVIVSDNASTDDTEFVCRAVAAREARFKYSRNPINLGVTANFNVLLKQATGEYFMWLGDDDWIDSGYVDSCLRELRRDPGVSLVSGIPRYYRANQGPRTGRVFSLVQNSGWRRVLEYYLRVGDNGAFYGLMRTSQLRKTTFQNTMGGDWLLVADIAFMGKIKMLPEVSVHREGGGTSTSYSQIASSFSLPKFYGLFPKTAIAMSAARDIALRNFVYQKQPAIVRWAAAWIMFVAIFVRGGVRYLGTVPKKIRKALFGKSRAKPSAS